MNSVLLNYYEAIEQASQDMLEAARIGNWDHVVKLEGACALLIAQLKHTAAEQPLETDEAQLKSRIMQRILVNDAEIRQLAEPWLDDLDDILAGRPQDAALSTARSRAHSMETRPAPLDALARRLTASTSSASPSPREIATLLRELLDGNVPLNLQRRRRHASTRPRSGRIDADARHASASTPTPATRALQSLLECDEVVVVGYLDSVKLQFDDRTTWCWCAAAGPAC